MRKIIISISLSITVLLMLNCNQGQQDLSKQQDSINSALPNKVKEYAKVKLTTDLNVLSAKEKQIVGLLFEAAKLMDDIFWLETMGDKTEFLNSIENQAAKEFAMINYGPWERLNGNKPFILKYGAKPLGVNFYPTDITKAEFEALQAPDKTSLYTVIRRKADKSLEVVPYHEAFKEQTAKVADLLTQAAALAEDAGLKKYFELRAKALLTDNYFDSDMAWMDMKTNMIDFVVGPIENYEDALFGYKAAFESFILVKDKEWSKRLEKYSALLPKLQQSLPVDDKYKKDPVGSNSDLNAYDVVYYAGDCNSGSKTIAINLPNDEKVQKAKGSRRLQLKNSIQAKFENILQPIANELIDESQLSFVKFDAFFQNIMFHEVAIYILCMIRN